MFVLFVILEIFLEIYTFCFLIYIVVQKWKKKTLPWLFILLGIGCIALFFYLRFLLNEHRLIFTGNYVRGSDDWGSGLANVGIYIQNMLILMFIFLLSQLFYWTIFFQQFRRINNKGKLKRYLS